MTIRVVDLFAGPGGLGEGFTAFARDRSCFDVVLSIEMDPAAHRTLELRAFFRSAEEEVVWNDYHRYLRGAITRASLFERHQRAAAEAKSRAWKCRIGDDSMPAIHERVSSLTKGDDPWVLVGGPPCQAYSLVGRARRTHEDRVAFEADHRHRLYEQYLRVLAEHRPPVFVMENVKGLLSAKHSGSRILDRILEDLQSPVSAVGGRGSEASRYQLFTLADIGGLFPTPTAHGPDFVLRAEEHGVPQRRHRVIIVGVRTDLPRMPVPLAKQDQVSVGDALADLPSCRSTISRRGGYSDSTDEWLAALRELQGRQHEDAQMRLAQTLVDSTIDELGGITDTEKLIPCLRGYCQHPPDLSRDADSAKRYLTWVRDSRLDGFVNHESRSHMRSDIQRYLYAACFAECFRKSPSLADFPHQLQPHHANAARGNAAPFSDRFRVQLRDEPSTTVTSHISKDGHYYIHFDRRQARSLTVREAARLQTFPDNYFFEGTRTEQYCQVGNAVPPLLAVKIAQSVAGVFQDIELKDPQPSD